MSQVIYNTGFGGGPDHSVPEGSGAVAAFTSSRDIINPQVLMSAAQDESIDRDTRCTLAALASLIVGDPVSDVARDLDLSRSVVGKLAKWLKHPHVPYYQHGRATVAIDAALRWCDRERSASRRSIAAKGSSFFGSSNDRRASAFGGSNFG
ncbi:MAG TPA: hypothetical protein VF628_14705 [Allosphingosinicella sp.]|jgi:hypothetical protein